MDWMTEWATEWGVSPAAVTDLINRLAPGIPGDSRRVMSGTEADAQQAIRLAACRNGTRLWRNNVGACQDKTGRHIRYGLANESNKLNKQIKSSDLIGITPRIVTRGDLGQTIGVFTSIEVKRPGWTYKNTPREQAQAKWLALVASLGGIARFATGPGDLV